MLRGIGNIGSPWVGAGECLQVVAERAASKHFGDFRNLGKSGPRADHTRRRTVDDPAVPEFGESQVRTAAATETCSVSTRYLCNRRLEVPAATPLSLLLVV